MKNTNKILTGIMLSMLSTFLIAITPANAAAELPCSSAVNFNPYIVNYMRGGDEAALNIPFTQTTGETTENCTMNIKVFNADGNPIPQSNTNNLFQIKDSQLIIQTTKLEKAFTEDGTYTIKFEDQNGTLIEGVLALDISSGAVLGAYNERSTAAEPIKVINLVFYTFLAVIGIYYYKTKKSSHLGSK